MTKLDSIYNFQRCSLLFNNLPETYLSIYSLKENELCYWAVWPKF